MNLLKNIFTNFKKKVKCTSVDNIQSKEVSTSEIDSSTNQINSTDKIPKSVIHRPINEKDKTQDCNRNDIDHKKVKIKTYESNKESNYYPDINKPATKVNSTIELIHNKDSEKNVAFNNIKTYTEDNNYISLDEFDKLLISKSNKNAISNMSLGEIVDYLGIKEQGQEETVVNTLQTTTCISYSEMDINNDCIMTEDSDDESSQYDETGVKIDAIDSEDSNLTINNASNKPTATVTNTNKHMNRNLTIECIENKIKPNKGNNLGEVTNTVEEQQEQNIHDVDLFQDIVLDLDTSLFDNTLLSDNVTQLDCRSTKNKAKNLEELKRKYPLSYDEEKMDFDDTPRLDFDDSLPNLSNITADEEMLEKNNVNDILSSTLEDKVHLITNILNANDINEFQVSQTSSNIFIKSSEITDTIENKGQSTHYKHTSKNINENIDSDQTHKLVSQEFCVKNTNSKKKILVDNVLKSVMRDNEILTITLSSDEEDEDPLSINSKSSKNNNNINSKQHKTEQNVLYKTAPKWYTENLKNNVDYFTIVISSDEDEEDILKNCRKSAGSIKNIFNDVTRIVAHEVNKESDESQKLNTNAELCKDNMNEKVKYNILLENSKNISTDENTIKENTDASKYDLNITFNKTITEENVKYTKVNDINPTKPKNNPNNKIVHLNTEIVNEINIDNPANTINNNTDDTDSDYNSSDFEFISEEEAKIDLLIDKTVYNKDVGITKWWCRVKHGNTDTNEYPGPSDYQNRHVVPQGESYLNLFQDNAYNPIISNIHLLEYKCIRPLRRTDRFQGLGFNIRSRKNRSDNENPDAAKTRRKIIEMYSVDNLHKRSRRR